MSPVLRSTLIAIAMLIAGCGKKDATQNPSATGTPTQAPATTAEAPAPSGTAAPAQPTVKMTDVQTAIHQKDYEKAAATLLVLQKQPATPQEGWAVNAEMQKFQGQLAAAAATGDPKAKAAIELLRRSGPH